VPLYLVVGAAGFIGRHVTAAARALPDVRVIGTGRSSPPPAFSDAFQQDWLPLDLVARPGDLAARLHELRPDAVVNCAGATTGPVPQLVALNVVATANLVEGLAASGPGARLVHIGSAAEYGAGPAGTPVAESASSRPVGPYGITKLAGTQLVAAAAAAGRVDAVVLRVFNVLGPRMPEGSVAGTALRRIADAMASGNQTIRMGPLDAVRDFVDVRDVAAAVVASLVEARLDAPIVNIGSGTAHTARELVEALAGALGFTGAISEDDEPSPRSAPVPWQVADVSLARQVLGWQPAHDFGAAVELVAGAPVVR
jgi:nucleoside-diphosphate-sugar epimerase